MIRNLFPRLTARMENLAPSHRYPTLPTLSLLSILLCLLSTTTASAQPMIWARGNLHTHTTNSDGDSSAKTVIDWYKSHGYQFLMISDHEQVTPVSGFHIPGFVLVPGEEILSRGDKLPTHANAIGITQSIPSPKRQATPGATAVNLIEYVRKAGGLPQLNHPFFYWFYGFPELMKEKGPFLMEVYNGAYDSKKWPESMQATGEEMWDSLLSKGIEVYATASDDAHVFKKVTGQPENPGRGWIYVRVPKLTSKAILAALRAGNFYASNGVELADYGFSGKTFKIRVAPKPNQTYRILFIGKGGVVLHEAKGTSASYAYTRTTDSTSYVRCKVVASNGKCAWTQAFWLVAGGR